MTQPRRPAGTPIGGQFAPVNRPEATGIELVDGTPGGSEPAPELVERSNGTKQWYLNGKLHRFNGPAIEWADGSNQWWRNGELHRSDGPAVEQPDGLKEWWCNGQLHRTDGPAIEGADGPDEWWVDGVQVSPPIDQEGAS